MSVTVLAIVETMGDYPRPIEKVVHERANDYSITDGMLFVSRVDDELGIAVYAPGSWFSAVIGKEAP